MVSSTSGLLTMCPVFLLREFNTLARNCDLALNQGVTYLKEPWGTMEGGRAAPGSPVLPPQARPYLTAEARAPRACSRVRPSAPGPVSFPCGTCKSLARTQQSESSRLALSKTLWPERDNEASLHPKVLRQWLGQVRWKVRTLSLVSGAVKFWTEFMRTKNSDFLESFPDRTRVCPWICHEIFWPRVRIVLTWDESAECKWYLWLYVYTSKWNSGCFLNVAWDIMYLFVGWLIQ